MRTSMVRLESVDIEGFKGLEETTVNLAGINVITGRNNTGKTSVLESIDLGLNPSHLNNYRPDIEGLIHVSGESKDLMEKKLRIGLDYDDGNIDLTIRHPERTRSLSMYLDFIESSLENVGEQRYYPRDELPSGIIDVLNNVIDDIQDVVASSPDETKKEIHENCYILEYNSNEYEYLYLSSFHEEIGHRLGDEHLDSFIQNANTDDLSIDNDELRFVLHDFVERPFYHHRGEGHFLNAPPEVDHSSFIRSAELGTLPSGDDDDDIAVKKTEIRDEINEKGILDGLQDFDFDELVLEEEDGSRYSVNFDYMGDGFRAIVGILWRFIDDDLRQDVMLLEEPENHMHPGYIHKLIPFLIEISSNSGVQLVVTTHNIDFIRGFLDDSLKKDQIDFLEDNLQVIRMTENIPEVMDYSQARGDIEDVKRDLRGMRE